MASQHQTRLGLARCEHCGRQFNPHSAARHIPWCAKQQRDNRRPNRLTADKREALERYKWRINYRPSNQLSQKPLRRPNATSKPFNPFKCSSLNSSASASSSNSTRTSIASVEGQQQQQRHQRAPSSWNAARAGARPGQPTALKRSVSSLTLVKQQGATEPNDTKSTRPSREGASSSRLSSGASMLVSGERTRTRTKSVSDLSNMSEVVETLAKRMDEIYLQNQRLLENLGEQAESSRSLEPRARCHHCKSTLQAQANYCHNCGCKVIRARHASDDDCTSNSAVSTPEPPQASD